MIKFLIYELEMGIEVIIFIGTYDLANSFIRLNVFKINRIMITRMVLNFFLGGGIIAIDKFVRNKYEIEI